jgi:formyltetrahydrofolate synthetase
MEDAMAVQKQEPVPADAVVTRNWAEGGEGVADLARAVARAAEGESPCKPGYLGMDIDVETGRIHGLS